MSSHKFALVWPGPGIGGLDFMRMAVQMDFAPYTAEGAIIVPEHHAKLAGRMLEALEETEEALVALLHLLKTDEERGENVWGWDDGPNYDAQRIAGKRLSSIRALLSEARAQGGSDE